MNDPLCGILVINKPKGMTSRRAVDVVARLVKPAKAGHAGTLDPMATGVLVICIGKATRLIGYVQEQAKTYNAGFRLGETSDTDDATGNISEHGVETIPELAAIESGLNKFFGRIQQVPPKFSAVHVDGQRAYKLARKGEKVALKSREVEVHRIGLQRYEFPELDVRIECGSGTYIRSIGRDLGEQLGCGALMSQLCRTAIGPFRMEDAVSPDDLSSDNLADLLLPPLQAVAHRPLVTCTETDLNDLSHGRRFPLRAQPPTVGEPVIVVTPSGELAAIAEIVDDGLRLAPRQVFV